MTNVITFRQELHAKATHARRYMEACKLFDKYYQSDCRFERMKAGLYFQVMYNFEHGKLSQLKPSQILESKK